MVWVGGWGFLGIPRTSNNPFHKGIPNIQTTGPQTTKPNHWLNNTASSRFLYATSNVSMTCLSCFWIEILANILKNAAWHGPFFPHLTRLLCWSETTPKSSKKRPPFFFGWHLFIHRKKTGRLHSSPGAPLRRGSHMDCGKRSCDQCQERHCISVALFIEIEKETWGMETDGFFRWWWLIGG